MVRQIWVGCILLSTAVGSAAATLGTHSGVAIIGRPLDLKVQVLLAPADDINALCIGANVFYGETQVPVGQVRSTLQTTIPNAESSFRIQSFQAVNEPIVTVEVRTGCEAPFIRRFVLLADLVTEMPMLSAPALTTEARVGADSMSALVLSPSGNDLIAGNATAGLTGRSEKNTSTPSGKAQTSVAAKIPAVQSEPSTQPVGLPPRAKRPSLVRQTPSSRVETTPRLQLELVDLSQSVERETVLKMSIALLSEPTNSDETRAAAAQLWRAINATPEDVLRDAQKLTVLETESKALREAETQTKIAIAELTSDLRVAKADRYMNWLVYLLSSALLLALLALAGLWRGRYPVSQAGPTKDWWASEGTGRTQEQESKDGESTIEAESDSVTDKGSTFGAFKWFGSPKSARNVSDRLSRPRGEEGSAISKDSRDFAPSIIGASRMIATEELFDIQQEADFFVSLGEDEKAIQVLRSHLNESQRPSSLAYLDLLKIYHRLGRREDYEQSCEEFKKFFNVQTPAFDEYPVQSLGLERHETALGRIQSLWPNPKVLDVIEQFIFRNPDLAEAEVFDLESYRDLLMLYGVANDIINNEAAISNTSNMFQQGIFEPLKVDEKATPTNAVRATYDFDMDPPVSAGLDIDIDLTNLSDISDSGSSFSDMADPAKSITHKETSPSSEPVQKMDNLIDFEVINFKAEDEKSQNHNPSV